MKKVNVPFRKLEDTAIIPTKAHDEDAGYDLYADKDVLIFPGENKIIPTNIAAFIDIGQEGNIRDRSGIRKRTKLRVEGTIDTYYDGNIGISVDNIFQPDMITLREDIYYVENDECTYTYQRVIPKPVDYVFDIEGRCVPITLDLFDGTGVEPDKKLPHGTYIIRRGDKIAQMVVSPVLYGNAVEVDAFDKTGERGSKGFGSSGYKVVEKDEE